MPTTFEQAFQAVIGHEGGYGADPKDRGNWTGGDVGVGVLKGTKFGISAAAYPLVDISNLTLGAAQQIYLRDYWKPCSCDALHQAVALVVFDTAINSGQREARVLLQKAVGAAPDGVYGPATQAAVDAFLRAHSAADLVLELLVQRVLVDASLASWTRYGKGWARRLFALVHEADAMPAPSPAGGG